MKQFCEELSAYNKVHRLIGNVSCETLLGESVSAISNTEVELSKYTCMVDVGAGSGILGYAWLESNLSRRCIFLEPDKKASAFLHAYFGGNPRAKVIQKKLEDLSLAELLTLEPDTAKIFLAARAFSSKNSLEDCYKKSRLNLELYNFEKRSDGFYLTGLK